MATIAEAKRRLTIEYRSDGAEKVAQDARKVEAGIDGVAVAGQRSERATQSVERSYASLQRRYDEIARAEMELARVNRIVTQARQQGLGTEMERARLMDAATAAINRQTSALRNNTAAAIANDNSVQFRRTNLGYQGFDIAQGVMAGTPLAMIAAQQGPQIAQLYAAQGGLNALWRDAIGILGGLARAAGPWIAAAATIYGAYRLIASYSAEAALQVDSATQSLADQAASIGGVRSGISELAGLQKTYQDTIRATGNASDDATAKIIANTRREFEARKALLDLEKLRQEAAIKVNEAAVAQQGLAARGAISGSIGPWYNPYGGPNSVNTNVASPDWNFLMDPRLPSVAPFRLPDVLTGLERTQEIIDSSPIFKHIKELRAEGELTKLTYEGLQEALKATFEGGELVKDKMLRDSISGRPMNSLPIPSLRGIDDMPGDVEFYRDLVKAGEQRLRQLQTESETLGMTAGAAAAYRLEQEAIASATARNVELGPDQVASIRKQAEAYGALTDAIARARLQHDLAFEQSQLFRSAGDQSIATRLRGAGMPVDLTSPEALQMRQIERIKELRDGIGGFVNDFRSEFLRSGGDIGEAFATAILNGINRELEKFIEMGVTALTQIIANRKGWDFSPTASGFADMLGGGQRMHAAANSNVGSGVYRDVIAAIESAGSGGYSAIGPTHPTLGRALGRYQIMEANVGPWSQAALGRRASASEFMANPSMQDAIFDHRFGGYVDRYGASGAASMWFTGRPHAPNARDVLGTSGAQYVDKFNAALEKASGGVAQFGTGLGNMGNALSQFPAAPSGGGMGGFLGSLFGGLSSAFAGTGAYSWLSANPGGYVGLYHDGRYPGQPGGLRFDDLSAYAGAPRYHDGRVPTLAPDEERAIIRKNEPVFRSMEHARQVVGGSQQAPTMTVVVNNAPAGARVREESGKDASGRFYKRAVIDIMNEAIASGEVDGAMGGRFGAAVPTVRRGAA